MFLGVELDAAAGGCRGAVRALAHELVVALADACGDLLERRGGEDHQAQQRQRDHGHHGAGRLDEPGQRDGGQRAEHAAGGPEVVEGGVQGRDAADHVGDAGAGHGEQGQADAHPVVGPVFLRPAEKPDGADEQDRRHEGRHEPERAPGHGVHERAVPADPAQPPPLDRGDDHGQDDKEKPGAVAAHLVGRVHVAADLAEGAGHHAGGAHPGRTDHAHGHGKSCTGEAGALFAVLVLLDRAPVPLEERAGAFGLPEGVRVADECKATVDTWVASGFTRTKPPESTHGARIPGAFTSRCEVSNSPRGGV